ncbi:toll/interleukin-1 receptor domain-containing adapter protein [Acanthochromis polyacanthus]|uniref:Toll-interleukin 1 receptor (TIR) domain containing adaptor protein n=1 Tax=Acanthochromis polyacanthus TaxID=80966 RepID=A0A3Q1FA93_9TELE|nr:toll/interleukin-1 receptor domain-containing adapter protein [Acanthochromis polyacanthus]
MQGWFQKLLKSRATTPREQESNTRQNSETSVRSALTSTMPTSALQNSSLGTAPSRQQFALGSELRWRRKYDVFVCHSTAHPDIEEATHLVSFLEASPHSLRCFLWQRDTCPGSAISTEYCEAVENSHLRALLITPSFVQDGWCNYMMHQALAEGPMSRRMIPLMKNLERSEYPKELQFYYYIDLSKGTDRGYALVIKSVISYLEDLVEKERQLNCSIDTSSGGLG